jgi:hypothetical protein
MTEAEDKYKVLIQEFNLGHEALNKALYDSAIEIMKQQKPSKDLHSNIGGWQGDRDLHAKFNDGTRLGKLLQTLFESFAIPITEYVNNCCVFFKRDTSPSYAWNFTGAWFNVAKKGAYNAPHTHPFNEISGAYYIRTEEPPKDYPFSGRIDFFHENGLTSYFPKPGDLILFPSSMLHFVHPYYGSEYRMSLSFNIKNIHPEK